MKDRAREVEMMLRIGSEVLRSLDEGGANMESVKHVFEAIRVNNTTLRTEIAIEKMKRAARGTKTQAKRAA